MGRAGGMGRTRGTREEAAEAEMSGVDADAPLRPRLPHVCATCPACRRWPPPLLPHSPMVPLSTSTARMVSIHSTQLAAAAAAAEAAEQCEC